MELLFINLVGIFSGLIIFCSLREHLLSALLSLEFMVLMMFLILVVSMKFSLYYSLFYLILTACEGALGLSILVIMGRTHGGDYFKSFNFMLN